MEKWKVSHNLKPLCPAHWTERTGSLSSWKLWFHQGNPKWNKHRWKRWILWNSWWSCGAHGTVWHLVWIENGLTCQSNCPYRHMILTLMHNMLDILQQQFHSITEAREMKMPLTQWQRSPSYLDKMVEYTKNRWSQHRFYSSHLLTCTVEV